MSNLDLRHPEDGLLLRYLDGELPGRKARQVRTHLEACWQCRAQVRRTARRDRRMRALSQECAGAQPAAPAGSHGAAWISNAWMPNWPRNPCSSGWRGSSRRCAIRACAGRSPAPLAVALCFVLVRQLRETPKVEAAALLQKAVSGLCNRVPPPVKRLRITTRTGQMTRVIGVAYKPPRAGDRNRAPVRRRPLRLERSAERQVVLRMARSACRTSRTPSRPNRILTTSRPPRKIANS